MFDAKADALLDKFKKLQQEKNDSSLKILVFTEFRTTQKMLHDFFTNKGYSCASINGSQDLDERKRALSNFKNDAQIQESKINENQGEDYGVLIGSIVGGCCFIAMIALLVKTRNKNTNSQNETIFFNTQYDTNAQYKNDFNSHFPGYKTYNYKIIKNEDLIFFYTID